VTGVAEVASRRRRGAPEPTAGPGGVAAPDPTAGLGAFLHAVAAAGARVGSEGRPDAERVVLATLARRLLAREGGGAPPTAPLTSLLSAPAHPVDLPEPPSQCPAPELMGIARQALMSPSRRRRSGAHYTPAGVAAGVCRLVLDGLGAVAPGPPAVCDPACGGGAFLVAAGRALHRTGWPADQVLANLYGADTDALAVEVTEVALWMLGTELGAAVPPARLRAADAFDIDWPEWRPGGFDAVVGNPPFLGQLRSATARGRASAARVRERFALGGYVDTSALFVLLGLDLVRTGGRVGLILPQSFLASRDAGPVRRKAAGRGRLVALWQGDRVFEAQVRTVAAVLERAEAPAGPHPVARWSGADFAAGRPVEASPARLAGPTWSWLVDDGAAPRSRVLHTDGLLGDHCRATADFRDQYYGLRGLVGEDPAPGARLVTAGLIDPARCRWGERSTRFAGRSYRAPVAEVSRLPGRMAAWAEARLVPKVLLATQTRVLEAVVDADGAWVPSVPVITIEAERLWHVAAALTSPVLTDLARREHAGAALSSDAIKLSAAQVMALPAPGDAEAWDEGAAAFRRASEASGAEGWMAELRACALAMTSAYGLDGAGRAELVQWWERRLPRPRAGTIS